MGIEGLSKLLSEKAPASISEVSLEEFRGAFIPVDVSSYLYQFAFNAEAKGKGSYLRGFFEMILTFRKYCINPIFVFDGRASPAKAKTLQQRRDATAGKLEKIQELTQDIAELVVSEAKLSSEQVSIISEKQAAIAKQQKNIILITREMIDNLKHLFSLCHVPFMQAEGEADFMCVKLCKIGFGSAVCSEDMDILTHGACLIRGINDNLFRTKSLVRFYHLPAVLAGLGMSQEEFIDMCILCGCDYCESPRGIGPKTAFSLIKEHRTIDRVKQHNKKFDMTSPEFTFEFARTEFTKSELEKPNTDTLTTKGSGVSKSDIMKFLLAQTNYTTKTLTRKLDEAPAPAPARPKLVIQKKVPLLSST